MSAKSDAELRAMTDAYRARLAGGEAPGSLLPEAFATVREAARRAIGQRPYDQQVMAGAALHLGVVVEMQAGEGKTLAITLPAYLNALTGSGVHVMTASTYLARRDHDSMRRVYEFLGMRAGVIAPGQGPAERRPAYSADVTYGGQDEFCYDYLRDNIAWHRDEFVQRGHHFGILDEADLLLIDRAVVPRRVTGPPDTPAAARLVVVCERLAQRMRADEHYQVDAERRRVSLTAEGTGYAGDWLGAAELSAPGNADWTRVLGTALNAKELYREGRDYVIRDGRLLAVDTMSGEVGPWSFRKSIQQALEAKEGLEIRALGLVLATLRTAGYLGLYDRLAGITSTAVTDADAYRQLYGLDVVAIPAITQTRRTRHPDALYATEEAKLIALADEATAQHLTGRPVLITYGPAHEGQRISRLLGARGVPHVLLDTADHDRELSAIASCGQERAVTLAAATAGRGINPALGDGTESGYQTVAGLGGLMVFSTQRQRTERLDLRIASRCGRRGAPGAVKFFTSPDDDTVRWLLGEQQARSLAGPGGEGGRRAKMAEGLITRRQRQAAAGAASRRAQELRFSRLVDQQRTAIYAARRSLLESPDSQAPVRRWISEVISKLAAAAAATWLDAESLWEEFGKLYPVTLTPHGLAAECGCEVPALPHQFIAERITEDALRAYDRREAELTREVLREVERRVVLTMTDRYWQEYLAYVDGAPESAWHPPSPEAFAARRDEMSSRFAALTDKIREESVRALFWQHIEVLNSSTRDRRPSDVPLILAGEAQRVADQAREEATALGFEHAGTGHVLLGLLGDSGGTAAQALRSLGITREPVARQVRSILRQREPAVPAGAPFTMAAAAALRASLREARRLSRDSPGPEHILLALTKDHECAAVEVLTRLGASPRQVRHRVLRLLYTTPEPESQHPAATQTHEGTSRKGAEQIG